MITKCSRAASWKPIVKRGQQFSSLDSRLKPGKGSIQAPIQNELQDIQFNKLKSELVHLRPGLWALRSGRTIAYKWLTVGASVKT